MEAENTMESTKIRLLAAALLHVPFDGWSETTLQAAMRDSGVAAGLARALYPRGGVDLAIAYHQEGDAVLRAKFAVADTTGLRIRERITLAVRLRLEAAEPELVRRASALFALPQHITEGPRLVWGTADAIWTALGDTSRDLNWYTKRATLAAVYAGTVLFWLGDQSEGYADTWAFLDRRIEGVMQFEKTKAGFRENKLGKALIEGPFKFLERIRAPMMRDDLPGRIGTKT